MRSRFFISLLVSALTIGFLTTTAYAEDVTSNNTGEILQLSPVRQTLSVSPGHTGQVTISVSNPTSKWITLQPTVEDFTTIDTSGTPALFEPTAGARSFTQFVQPLSQITVVPGDTNEVKLVITVPSNAAPGGYYGAVRFTPATAEAGAVSTSAASLILLTVPGKVNESLNLAQFTVTPPTTSLGAIWFGGGKSKLAITFKNNGAIHEAPVGQIYIKKGKVVVKKLDFNQTQPYSYILPGSSRAWQLSLAMPSQFGHYTIGAVFTYCSKNQTIETSLHYWMVPRSYIIGAGGAILLICLLVAALLLRRR